MNSMISPPMRLLPFGIPFIRHAEISYWPPGYKWGPRRIYDHEIIYVVEGEISVELGDRQFLARTDQVFLIPPRVVQTFHAGNRSERQDHIGVHFDWLQRPDSDEFYYVGQGPNALMKDAQESLFREYQAIPGWNIALTPMLDLRGRPRVRTLLREVLVAQTVGGENALWQAGALLVAAIAQLGHEADLVRDIAANPHLGPDAVRRVQRARELLEDQHSKPLTVGEVAVQVGWSADHLGRMCREVVGVSPYRIQTLARLNRAREMLRQRSHSISSVAEHCGFKDVSHFMSTFKRETGLTARQFMEQGSGKDRG